MTGRDEPRRRAEDEGRSDGAIRGDDAVRSALESALTRAIDAGADLDRSWTVTVRDQRLMVEITRVDTSEVARIDEK